MFFVLLVYALFASVFTVEKEILQVASPIFILGSRMCVAGLGMLIFQFFKNKSLLFINKEQLLYIVLLGFFNIYLTNALELWGMQYVTSFKACFLYSLSPFLTVLFSYLMLRETLSLKKWVGLLIGCMGFIPILLGRSHSENIAGEIGLFSYAELALLGAVLSSVFGWIFLKKLVSHLQCSFLVANGYSMLLGGLIGLGHSLRTETWAPIPVTNTWIWIECSLFLLIISNLICYNLYGWLLKKFSTTFLSFAGLSTPLFTALFGWFFLDEQPNISFFISLTIVFFGQLMFYLEEMKQQPQSSTILSEPVLEEV